MSLSTNVRRLRAGKGWSQEALARTADVSMSTVVRVEGGNQNPRIDIVAKLADALGATVDDLLTEVAS